METNFFLNVTGIRILLCPGVNKFILLYQKERERLISIQRNSRPGRNTESVLTFRSTSSQL